MRPAQLALLLAFVAGCTTNPMLPGSATLPPAARSDPGLFLVVTIRNPIVPPPARAASTLRGYEGAGSYFVGGEARSAARALAVEYGLVEVSSWPITWLGVNCLVYGILAGSDGGRITAA